MRITLAAAVLAVTALADTGPSHAYEGPWCAYMTAGRDYYDRRCDLPNYEACRAEIAATPGTWCTQNPRYVGPPERPVRLKKKRQRSG
jgi:hypothetical protein